MKEIEYIVEKIDEILNSTSSKLSKKDLTKLVTVREKIKAKGKNANRSFLYKILGGFLFHLFTGI